MPEEKLAPGLYLVGTPLGNLEDITLRALRVLKEADLIACEDTRETEKLLEHYHIKTLTISYHEHNEASRAVELADKLSQGVRIAVVSDRGMPGISDPGFRLVSLAVERGIRVVPVPGPSAFVAALVASGLPLHSFAFRGFLPAKRGERLRALGEFCHSAATQILYEAPHRILELLEDAVSVLGGNRRAVLARELTKVHEEFLRGSLDQVRATVKARGGVKGEITLLIGPALEGEEQETTISIPERVRQITAQEGLEERAALKKVAKERGLSKSEIYRQLQRGKTVKRDQNSG